MFDDLRRWLEEPAGEFRRCMGCGRLRNVTWFVQRWREGKQFCPCGRNPKRALTEPHPDSIRWWERKRILVQSLVEYWRIRHERRSRMRADNRELGRPT